MMGEIEVLQPGLFSTIQDLGRFGFREYGVPLSGSMDSYASRLANLILHNSPGDPVLEITQIGPKLKFLAPANIVITGAEFSAGVGNRKVKNNRIQNVLAGEVLTFGERKSGSRAYLAIKGGFQCEEILGSCSWYDGLTTHCRLEKGIRLRFISCSKIEPIGTSVVAFRENYLFDTSVPVFPGPEFTKLPQEFQKQLCEKTFSIDPMSNRMAIQLKEDIGNDLDPIITGPVIPGTVQLTPSGKLIVLMRDCQTTGGYPRVLQVSEKGLNILAQKITGDNLEFELLNEH